MKNKIINANFFKASVTNKTNWLFLKLENELGNIGWGEATLQGKEKEIFKISEQIFGLILNKNYSSPYDLKKHLPFKNILEASLSSSILASRASFSSRSLDVNCSLCSMISWTPWLGPEKLYR